MFYINISGKPKAGELIKNVQCGYDVRKDQYVSNSFLSKGFMILKQISTN